MDLNRFRACASAYGAARRRWPGADRALFDHFARLPEGAAILAEAERTDRFLDQWRLEPPGDALAPAIAAGAVGVRARRVAIGWQIAAVLVITAVGFAIGFMTAPQDDAAELALQLLLGPARLPGITL